MTIETSDVWIHADSFMVRRTDVAGFTVESPNASESGAWRLRVTLNNGTSRYMCGTRTEVMEAGNRVAAAVDPTLSTGPRDRAATAGGSRRDSVTTVNVPTLKASAPGDSTSWYLRPDGMLAGSVDDVFISPLGRRTISFEQITQFCSTVEWDEDTPVQLPDGSEVPVFPAMPGQVLRGDSPSLNVEPEQLAHLVFNFRENGTMTRWHRRWELSFVPDQRYLVGMAPLRTKTCAIRNSDGVR